MFIHRKEYIEENPYFKEWINQYIGESLTSDELIQMGHYTTHPYKTRRSFYYSIFKKTQLFKKTSEQSLNDAKSPWDHQENLDLAFLPWLYEIFITMHPQCVIESKFDNYSNSENINDELAMAHSLINSKEA